MRFLGLAVISALVLGGATAGAQGIGSPMRQIPSIPAPSPPVQPAPPAVQAAPPSVQASRIHRNAAGQWEPDTGCHWRNDDDPNDFRVHCDDD